MADEDVNVKVAVRCRPLNEKEKAEKADLCLKMDGKSLFIDHPVTKKEKTFTFDQLYWTDSEQESLYKEFGVPILDKSLEGYNGTIFAYGQTGSGKTFSMTGDENSEEGRGLIPRMNVGLFDRISEMAASSNRQFMVLVSYVEIYLEKLSDLLNPSAKKLVVREHPSYGVEVVGLAEIMVKSADQMHALMEQGNTLRQVGETKMNQKSSRSHAIFTVSVKQKYETEDGETKTEHQLRSKIHLVDLAGSERLKKTGAEGKRKDEGVAINLSLHTLMRVIASLAGADKKSGHIPYRDSALTRLLQDALGGNSVTVMLATVSPASTNHQETFATLDYANLAKNIKNKSKKNEDETTRKIRELQTEIQQLRLMLEKQQSKPDESEMEKYLEMEDKMLQYDAAVKETWDEKEKLSSLYEQERIQNLANRGLVELLKESLPEGKMEIVKKLGDLKVEEQRIQDAYRKEKRQFAKLQKALEALRNEKSDLEEKRGLPDADIEALNQSRGKADADMEEVKKKQRECDERRRKLKERHRAVQKEKLKTQQLLQVDADSKVVTKKEQEEKMRSFYREIKRRMQDKLDHERQNILKQAESGKVGVKDYVNLELKLFDEQEDRRALAKQVQGLMAEKERREEKEERLRDVVRLQSEKIRILEDEQARHYDAFRKYREFHEAEKKRIEEAYRSRLEQSIRDIVLYGEEISSLRQRIKEYEMMHDRVGAAGVRGDHSSPPPASSGGVVGGGEGAAAPVRRRPQLRQPPSPASRSQQPDSGAGIGELQDE